MLPLAILACNLVLSEVPVVADPASRRRQKLRRIRVVLLQNKKIRKKNESSFFPRKFVKHVQFSAEKKTPPTVVNSQASPYQESTSRSSASQSQEDSYSTAADCVGNLLGAEQPTCAVIAVQPVGSGSAVDYCAADPAGNELTSVNLIVYDPPADKVAGSQLHESIVNAEKEVNRLVGFNLTIFRPSSLNA